MGRDDDEKGQNPEEPRSEESGQAGEGAPGEQAAAPETTPPPADPLEEARARVAALEQEKAELRDRMLRIAADFDNYKKRARKDLQEAQDRGREALLRELLQVIDNLERALAHAEQTEDNGRTGLLEGVRLVFRQFITALEKFDVRPFSALGETFDPQYHSAIQQVETDDEPAGKVVQEYQKGYRIGERLLRPAMVVVAKPKTPPPAPGPEEVHEEGAEPKPVTG